MQDSSGAAYLLIERAVSFEEQIQNKARASNIIFVKEENLDESSQAFLRNFIPSNNQVESLVGRMDQRSDEQPSLMAEL